MTKNILGEANLRDQLDKYNFYHTIKLTDSISTPGIESMKCIVEPTLPTIRALDLKGKRVLDIGCRDGLFSFEAEKLGAREVIAIDNDISPGATEFLIPYLGSRVQMHEMNLFDLSPKTFGKFDVVFCLGVLYHLRYPFWAMKILRDLLEDGGQMILETGVLVDSNRHCMLYCPTGDDSPYESSSCTFFNVKALVESLNSLEIDVQQVHYHSSHIWRGQQKVKRASLRRRLRNLFGFRSVSTARVCLVCQLNHDLKDKHLAVYWDKTHAFHSNRAA